MKLQSILKWIVVVTLSTTFDANAANIAVYGGYYATDITNWLNTTGNAASNRGEAEITGTDLLDVDVVIMDRTISGNIALADFIYAGGKLITEWSSSQYGMNLLGGRASDNYDGYITNDSINFSASGLALGLGQLIGASYRDGDRTEFFQDFDALGSGSILATRGSSGAPVIVGGSYGAGYIFVNGFDWSDAFPSASSQTRQLLLNQIDPSQVPVPAALWLFGSALAAVSRFGRIKRSR
ncbi:hypothetical protein ACH518_09375 [Methylomonas sp. HW2-6]|uniref:hypothetical protein n=1 Tax=Methylomonas sp. HW2-6 TaxID=3376687 RepID=UPI0040429B12